MKDPVKRVIRQAMFWQKILANHMSDKGFIIKVYQELLKLNSKEAVQLEDGQKT